MKQATLVLTIIVVGVVILLLWKNCRIYCSDKSEGYIRNPLNSIGQLKRTPVTYAFKSDGVTNNPHFKADSSDKSIPLEFGGHDPYRRVVNTKLEPLRRATTTPCMNPADCGNAYIVNDSKARRDMMESGDMQWFRNLDNMPTTAHKMYMSDRQYDVSASTPDFEHPPLYNGAYHYDSILAMS